MKKGIVLASSYGNYEVECDQQRYILKPRGVFRFHDIKPMVGDYCLFDEKQEVICEILPRKNTLYRPMIANVDQAYIVVSAKEPDYAPLLVNKFLTYLLGQNIAPAIIITKMDLLKDKKEIFKWKEIYESINIPVYLSSLHDDEQIRKLKKSMEHKTVVFLGQSGVGKSSLINLLFPQWQRKIGEYSMALGRGKHQTKEVILLTCETGYVADTPGFSSLDLRLSNDEICHFYPGLDKYVGQCFFKDCHHIHEKGCLLKEDISSGKYSQELYENYVCLLTQNSEQRRK